MKRAGRLAVLAASATFLGGCYESDFPLDAKPQVSVDPAVLGTWRCLPIDGGVHEEAATMTISRAGERSYSVNWQEGDKPPDRYESHVAIVAGTKYLNIRELGEGNSSEGKKWVYGRYVLLRPRVLQISIVDDRAMKGVEKTPEGVRRALQRSRNDPRLLVDLALCARAKDASPPRETPGKQ